MLSSGRTTSCLFTQRCEERSSQSPTIFFYGSARKLGTFIHFDRKGNSCRRTSSLFRKPSLLSPTCTVVETGDRSWKPFTPSLKLLVPTLLLRCAPQGI